MYVCVCCKNAPQRHEDVFFCESKQKESSHWEHIFFYDLYLNFNNRAAKQDGAEQSQTTSSNWVPKSVVNDCFDGVSTKLVNIVLFSVRWRGGSLLRVFENAFCFGGEEHKSFSSPFGPPVAYRNFSHKGLFPANLLLFARGQAERA